MVAKGFNIHWENEAKLHLKQACAYIRKDSVQNALKVKKEILDIITTLSIYPEKYSLDKYKKTMTAVIGLLKNTITELHTGFPIVRS